MGQGEGEAEGKQEGAEAASHSDIAARLVLPSESVVHLTASQLQLAVDRGPARLLALVLVFPQLATALI